MTTAEPFHLTKQQKNFFDTFGYLVLPGLLKEEIPAISAAFDRLFAENDKEVFDWLHEAHYMKSRRILLQFIERDPYLRTLLEHPVIDSVFSELLGKDYLYRASDGNVFTGDTYWHSDLYGANFKYRHIKILFYLDPLDANSGAFQAIPGSHLFGDRFANQLENFVWKHEENYGLSKDEVPAVTLPTQPGDAVIFDYRLKHATSNTAKNRRMFSICASQRFDQEDLSLLADAFRGFLPTTNGCLFWPGFTETVPPAVANHIDQCLAAMDLIHQQEKTGNPVA